MNPYYLAATAFSLAAIAGCSSPIPAPLALGEQQDNVPAKLTGNWACGTNHTEKDITLVSEMQRAVNANGQTQFVGQLNFTKADVAFSVSMFGEGEVQMVDGKIRERLDSLIILPTTANPNQLAVAYLKASINQKLPTYETGSYSLEGESLTSISDRRGIETSCTNWDAWEKMCEEQNNANCGVRMDKAMFSQTKQDFFEKQNALKSTLNK